VEYHPFKLLHFSAKTVTADLKGNSSAFSSQFISFTVYPVSE